MRPYKGNVSAGRKPSKTKSPPAQKGGKKFWELQIFMTSSQLSDILSVQNENFLS